MIGHNRGPTLEGARGWYRYAWARARRDLLPHLPIEVLRGRLKRAAELGLDYGTYAGIRATSGRDVVAVLFSSNALAMHRGGPMPPARQTRIARVGATRIGLATPPVEPAAMLAAPLHQAWPAPHVLDPPRRQLAMLRQAMGENPAGQTLLIGAYAAERDWCALARLAAYLPAETFFAQGG